MTIRTSGIITGFSSAEFVRMKNQMADLQRQLGSGKKSETYGGLGSDRGFSLAFRASVSQIDAWSQSISLASTRISMIDTSLSGLQSAVDKAASGLQPTEFTLTSGRTIGQVSAGGNLDAIVSMLNVSDGSRYLFGGRKTATPPVVEPTKFINGADGKDGFRTVMVERMQADLGAASATPETDATATGRVTLSATGTAPVTLAEDGVHSFGLKLQGLTGPIDGLTLAGPSGSPASLSIGAGTGNASAGQTVTLTFGMPDGSSETMVLKAVDANTDVLGAGEFRVGADATETLGNLRAALGDQLNTMVHGKLAAASAVKAGDDFFKGEPAETAGPPVVSIGAPKRLVAGVSGTMADAVAYDTPANAEAKTVRWYQGDLSADRTGARATASAEIDRAQSVSYGVRADEEALRTAVQNLAVASTMTFQSSDPHALDRYQALTPRVVSGLRMENSSQSANSIRIEISAANSAADAAKTRHSDTKAMLGGLLTDIEGVDDNTVAVQILALQTNLQASYQTTSMLSQLSILKYM